MINWKTKKIFTKTKDNILLEGEICYWAKDYSITLLKPFKVKGCGSHLGYAFPIIFIAEESEKSHTAKNIDLIERGKKELIRLYTEHKK